MPAIQTKKPARTVLPVPTERAAMLERWKDFPAVDVVENYLLNPGDSGSLPILLVDEDPHACVNTDHMRALKPGATTCHQCKKPARKYYVRWMNTGQEGRAAQLRGKGFVKVEIGQLRDVHDVSDLIRMKDEDSGKVFVTRGDRGAEILIYQPLELYNARKQAEADRRSAEAKSVQKRRAMLAERAGASLGDEAGQSIHEGAIKEEYFKRSKTTIGEEAANEGDKDDDE